nr:14206_t:CDS:2 [Entrophospora candida]
MISESVIRSDVPDPNLGPELCSQNVMDWSLMVKDAECLCSGHSQMPRFKIARCVTLPGLLNLHFWPSMCFLKPLLKMGEIIWSIVVHQQQIEGLFNKYDIKTHPNMKKPLQESRMLLFDSNKNQVKITKENLAAVRKEQREQMVNKIFSND